MRLEHRGEYPPNWEQIARDVKWDATWRCIRCRHPFYNTDNRVLACDPICDRARCKAQVIAARGGQHNFTVHHLDGDKANCAWWNLLALCNSCHLTIQAKVIPDRPYLWEHAEWFKPYVAGFYASYYGGQQLERAEVMADLERYLVLGQPWRAEAEERRANERMVQGGPIV